MVSRFSPLPWKKSMAGRRDVEEEGDRLHRPQSRKMWKKGEEERERGTERKREGVSEGQREREIDCVRDRKRERERVVFRMSAF